MIDLTVILNKATDFNFKQTIKKSDRFCLDCAEFRQRYTTSSSKSKFGAR